MKKYVPFIVISVILSICFSCIKNNFFDDDSSTTTITGEGDVVEKYVNLDNFTKINLVGQADINIIKGDTQCVKIRAQENVFEVMVHEVLTGEFKIGVKDNYSINSSKGIFVDIVTPSEISNINIVGAGNINFGPNKQESLNINITGAGEVNAFDVEVDYCTITIAGAGNCNVNVNKTLTVNIAGAGNVYYKGHPNIISNIAGNGDILSAN